MSFIRSSIKRVMPSALMESYYNLRRRREVNEWVVKGRPVPPPHYYKQRLLLEYAKRYKLSTLVETGTYEGDMVEACRRRFRAVFSIEIDASLYQKAKERFRSCAHVTIVQGDSADVLPGILDRVEEPCLFWLDGHYSGGITGKGNRETPIDSELRHIRRHGRRDVILIDDARCFVGANDYPTIEELRAHVEALWPGYRFEVADDIIRIAPGTWLPAEGE
jgi:hypothetical protein